MSVGERRDPSVFQEASDDALYTDVSRQPWDAGPQATNAPDDKFD
jgi:hypothetical protein